MALHVKMFDLINTIYSLTRRPFHLWSAYSAYPNLSWSGCLSLPLSFCFSTDCQSRGATVGCQLGVCTYRWWSGDGLWYHHHIRNYLLRLDVFRWSRRKLGKTLDCQGDHVCHHQTPFYVCYKGLDFRAIFWGEQLCIIVVQHARLLVICAMNLVIQFCQISQMLCSYDLLTRSPEPR